MKPQKIKTSAGMETVDETVARAKKQLGSAYVPPTPVAPAPTTTAITADNLKPTPTPVVTPPTPAVEAPKLQSDLEVQTDAFTQSLTNQKKAAESGKQTALTEYIDSLKNRKGLTTLTAEQYAQKGGVNDITPELNDINDQIRREQLSVRRAQEAIMAGGGQSKAQAQAQIANVQRESLAKQADLSIIQMAVQGRYDSAKEIADRAVAAQLEQQTLLNDALKFNYQENKDLFTTAEQREFETLLGNRTRAIQDEKDRLTEIKSFALQALQAGASVSEAKQMMSAKTLEEAMSIGGGYFRPKPATGGGGAPTIKTINGVDYQWNPSTQSWEVPGVGAAGTDTATEQARNQISFLRNTIKDAKGLVSATGPNVITRTLGNVFVGNTRVKQLENKIDTLKTNLLTLNSDPNLKKFFGPQMTEKDTQLLMSAGSTLNAYDNSEADNVAELKRYDDLLKKIEGTLPAGATVSNALPAAPQARGIDNRLLQGNLILTPDGQQVEIID